MGVGEQADVSDAKREAARCIQNILPRKKLFCSALKRRASSAFVT